MPFDDPIARRIRDANAHAKARQRRAAKIVNETLGKRRRGAIIARLREPDRRFGRR